MKALLLLAVALINASPKEQDLMLADLYAADPRLAVEVLEVADVLDEYEGWPCANELGADTDELESPGFLSDPGQAAIRMPGRKVVTFRVRSDAFQRAAVQLVVAVAVAVSAQSLSCVKRSAGTLP